MDTNVGEQMVCFLASDIIEQLLVLQSSVHERVQRADPEAMTFADGQVEDHTSRAMWLGPANKLKVEPLLPFERKMKQKVAEGADEAEVLWEHHK